jgi:hypothetical protein
MRDGSGERVCTFSQTAAEVLHLILSRPVVFRKGAEKGARKGAEPKGAEEAVRNSLLYKALQVGGTRLELATSTV